MKERENTVQLVKLMILEGAVSRESGLTLGEIAMLTGWSADIVQLLVETCLKEEAMCIDGILEFFYTTPDVRWHFRIGPDRRCHRYEDICPTYFITKERG